jgi:hypothetical protein
MALVGNDGWQENPRLALANPLHSDVVAVMCTLSSIWIFGPVLIDSTVTSDVYLSLISDEFVLLLMRRELEMNSAWFQQDGARPHPSNSLHRFLRDIFEERSLSNRYTTLFQEGFSSPLTSSNLNPCDYFRWEYLKVRLFRKMRR